MIILQLSISSISLSSISFKIINPNNPTANLALTKNDVILTLNDKPFTNFTLIPDVSYANLYKIIPFNDFQIPDNLYIQVVNPSFVSNKFKILFCQMLIDGKITFPFAFCKYDPNKNTYVFTLTSINGMPFSLTSNPITVSNPIDPLKSELIPSKNTYISGEIIDSTVRLIDIYGSPVPDGLYEIKINYSDAV